MKNYLGLVAAYEKVHRQRKRISLLCITISVCLVTAIFGMADMGIRSEINYEIKTRGNYHITLTDIDEETAGLIGSRTDVAVSGWSVQSEWILQSNGATLQGRQLGILGLNEALAKEMNMVLLDGTYPEKPEEALLDNQAMEQYHISINDVVSVTLPDTTLKDYKIAGIFADTSMLLNADAHGLLLSESAIREIADNDFFAQYFVQFKSGVNMRGAIDNIKYAFNLSDEQVTENAALLGLMGQSSSSLMFQLYRVAFILVCLVLIAGTIMIAASFNTNVQERTQFFGLLRCLGASKKQVKRFVMVEGLRQCLKGVPFGLLAGQCIIWIACAYLKFVNSAFFSEIPLFQISGISLLAGTVVGFLTVLLAALSPAKKASRVSPLTAVSGNAGLRKASKTINTNHFRVETAMGISHALSGKRNIVLMISSFAISIVLFLSFYIAVSFLHQAMPALKPYAPDISIVTEDNGLSLAASYAEKIQEIAGVKRVYGRMFAYDLPATSDAGNGTITLISYEDHQFGWAERELLRGNLETVKNGQDHILSVYGNSIPWDTGDTITLHGAAGDKELTVGGILTTIPFSSKETGMGFLICSEETFISLIGSSGYSIIDVQLENSATDNTVSEIRGTFPGQISFYDKRLSNSEAQAAYYTGAIFVYGFLTVIALITVFNILNSMNASVSTRMRQYGIMRSIGMSAEQLYRMVAAEAATYAVFGCIAGCILGLPLNKLMFESLITEQWGIPWQIPVIPLLGIVLVCLISAALSILQPIKQIRRMTIVDAIKGLHGN